MNEPVDGVSVLRQALRARNKTPNMLSLIASEIDGVGVSTLEDFSNNKANLGIETLQALAKILLDAECDPESGMLRSANRSEAKSMGTHRPLTIPKRIPTITPRRSAP